MPGGVERKNESNVLSIYRGLVDLVDLNTVYYLATRPMRQLLYSPCKNKNNEVQRGQVT